MSKKLTKPLHLKGGLLLVGKISVIFWLKTMKKNTRKINISGV